MTRLKGVTFMDMQQRFYPLCVLAANFQRLGSVELPEAEYVNSKYKHPVLDIDSECDSQMYIAIN